MIKKNLKCGKNYEYVTRLDNKSNIISNCCEIHYYLDFLKIQYPSLYNAVLFNFDKNNYNNNLDILDQLINDIEKIKLLKKN